MSIAKVLLVLSAIGVTVWSFLIPPAQDFREPELARIICFHLPCAFGVLVWLVIGGYSAIRALISSNERWDDRVAASCELATLLACLTMATGMLFSRVQWGQWWQWDPRQTSFLFVLLILLGCLALRAAQPEERARAKVTAAYLLVSFVPLFFLILVYPRLEKVQSVSFHPSSTLMQGGFDRNYWMAICGVALVLLWATYVAYRTRVRAAERVRERANEIVDVDSSGAAAHRVVEPVPIRKDME